MKVFILIVSLFITSNFLLAQHTYVPFAKPNKYWFYNVSDGSENLVKNTSSYAIWTKGDTVISGLNYVQMFKSDLREVTIVQSFPASFLMFLMFYLTQQE